MSIATVRKQIEEKLAERKKVYNEMHDILKLTQGDNARTLTGEERTKANKLKDDFDAINSTLNDANGLYAQLRELEGFENIEVFMRSASEGIPATRGSDTAPVTKHISGEEFVAHQRKILTAAYTRNREELNKLLNAPEARTGPSAPMLSAQLDAGGAVVIPTVLFNQIVEKKRKVTFWRNNVNVLPMPVAKSITLPSLQDDMDDAEWTKEGQEVGTTRDVLEQKTLTPSLVSKIIEVGESLLDGSLTGFDVGAWVNERAAYKFDVTIENAILTGNGLNKPLGLSNLPSTRQRDVCNGSNNVFQYADGISAYTSLRPGHRNSAKTIWVVGSYLFNQMLACTDSTGRPLWQPSLIVNEPDKFLNKSVFESEFLPATEPLENAILGYFMDAEYYWVPMVSNLRMKILDQTKANKHLVQFRFSQEIGGQWIYDEAFTQLLMPAVT